jgi:polygalacturonase
MKRRATLKSLSALPLMTWLDQNFAQIKPIESNTLPWNRAQSIIEQLSKPLSFPNRIYDIVGFGALPCETMEVKGCISDHESGLIETPRDGSFNCFAAINQAIETCHRDGGGQVLIPRGNWYCAGPIILRSNVHLHLSKSCHVFFSNSPQDYAKHGDFDCGENGKLSLTRWQGNDCLNFSSMIYAIDQHNIAITGEDWSSILDGQGGVPFKNGQGCWWDWKESMRVAQTTAPQTSNRTLKFKSHADNLEIFNKLSTHLSLEEKKSILGLNTKGISDENLLPALSEARVPVEKRVFGLGHKLRPCMINLVNCKQVLLEGYQLTQSPFWQHHPINCQSVQYRRVYANSLGPNSDGFDPESCDQVLIEDCTFNTGDDCIAIKAGKNLDTQLGPSQNIVIQHCVMQSGHGGVTLGSEMSAGINNVFVQDLLMENINWRTNPLNTAIRLKTNMNRGGSLNDLYVRRVSIPNGVQTTPSFYKSLPTSPYPQGTVSSSAGAVITIDCDYAAVNDSIRTRPPSVSRVEISEVMVGNVSTKNGEHSCYRPILILGPLKESYNGNQANVAVASVSDISISNCDFGSPVMKDEPFFLHNVKSLSLNKVIVDGHAYTALLHSKDQAGR